MQPVLAKRSLRSDTAYLADLDVQARPSAAVVLLLISDALALLAAIWCGVFLWTLAYKSVAIDNYFVVWPTIILHLIVFAHYGLYRGVAVGAVEELRSIAHGTTIVCLLLAAGSFLAKDLEVYSRGVFVSAWLLGILFVPIMRVSVRNLFASKPWWGVPALVLGSGAQAEMFLRKLQNQPSLGLKPVACFDDGYHKQKECAGVPVAGPLSFAAEVASRLNIRYAVITAQEEDVQERLLRSLGHNSPFTHLVILPKISGMGTVWVSPKDFNGVLGLELRQNLLIPLNAWTKRVLDTLVAGALGLVALPLIGIAAVCIRFVSPGPVFYSQVRHGRYGRDIRVWKLRTMYLNAEELLRKTLREDPAARAEWQRFFKLKHDPRILPGIGKLLRLSSLDELPQLWNVLKGEMSLVGPRPFPAYHLDEFGPEFRELRARVMPGLTGLWQISARSDGDLQVQETLDTYYIRNWSLWLDVYILFRTAAVVFSSKGAY
jgi:Undecaprenyl-phosphate galactose phosphotransferase WbaP